MTKQRILERGIRRTMISNQEKASAAVAELQRTDRITVILCGTLDLTPTVHFVLEWECREEASAFDNVT